MNNAGVKIGLIALAAVASIGVIVAGAGTAQQLFSHADNNPTLIPGAEPTVITTDTTATITWTTTADVVGAVKYGPSDADISIPAWDTEPVSKKDHTVKITGLLPERTYFYRINPEITGTPGQQSYQFQTKASTTAVKTDYPDCDIEAFKVRYGATTGQPNYLALYDLNMDGTINSNDFFECLKVNPK